MLRWLEHVEHIHFLTCFNHMSVRGRGVVHRLNEGFKLCGTLKSVLRNRGFGMSVMNGYI